MNQLSFWEQQTWFSNIDYTIVGSGIVGLQTAIHLKTENPKAKIVILERSALPQGASTKNAGFACFGSISEIIDDLSAQSEEDVFSLIQRRFEGLKLLRNQLGDATIDYKPFGGYELFLESDEALFQQCLQRLPQINSWLRSYFKADVFVKEIDRFGFKKIHPYVIFNPFEGQIDTGKMMFALLKKAREIGIEIFNGIAVERFEDSGNTVEIQTNSFTFTSKKLLFATNGFAQKLSNNQVRPARAQVLITTEIPNLDIKGTFHLDRGYYYFRNIGNRILFGGGRNLDFETEFTDEFGLNHRIQSHLEDLLKTVILPDQTFEIESRWSGIMGMGNDKNPLVTSHSKNVHYGVRLGGMGIAIGSLIGKELAELAL